MIGLSLSSDFSGPRLRTNCRETRVGSGGPLRRLLLEPRPEVKVVWTAWQWSAREWMYSEYTGGKIS